MPEHWQSPVAAGIGMSQLWGWGSRCGWLIPQNMPRGEIGYQWPLTLQSKLSHLIEGTWFCLHICGLLLESRGSQKSRHLDRLSKVLTDFESCIGRKLNPKVFSLVIWHAVFQDQPCLVMASLELGCCIWMQTVKVDVLWSSWGFSEKFPIFLPSETLHFSCTTEGKSYLKSHHLKYGEERKQGYFKQVTCLEVCLADWIKGVLTGHNEGYGRI